MNGLSKNLLSLVLVLSLLGCASAQLTITSDLYMEDPRVPDAMTPSQASQVQSSLKRLGHSAEMRQHDLRIIAQMHFDLYRLIWTAVGGSENDLAPLRKQLQAHMEMIDARQPQLQRLINTAVAAMESYRSSYINQSAHLEELTVAPPACEAADSDSAGKKDPAKDPARTRLARDLEVKKQVDRLLRQEQETAMAHVQAVELAYLKSLAPVESDFRLAEQFDQVTASVSSIKAILNEKQKKTLAASEQSIKAQIAMIRAFAKEMENRYSGSAILESLAGPCRGSLFDCATSVANNLQSLPAELSATDKGRDALTRLVQNRGLQYNLIDRLQDMGDPVWREVSDPRNACLWNTKFSETFFQAKGDTSVVVVRDGPAEFRIQRANNDPTALVRGQLQVSRSIAGAAISVAGAATGVPVASLSSVGDTGVTPGSSSAATASEHLARRKAEAEVAAARRSAAMTSLSVDLRNIRLSLTDTKETDPRYKALLQRLRSTLDAHGAIFQADNPGP